MKKLTFREVFLYFQTFLNLIQSYFSNFLGQNSKKLFYIYNMKKSRKEEMRSDMFHSGSILIMFNLWTRRFCFYFVPISKH